MINLLNAYGGFSGGANTACLGPKKLHNTNRSYLEVYLIGGKLSRKNMYSNGRTFGEVLALPYDNILQAEKNSIRCPLRAAQGVMSSGRMANLR